MIFTASSVFFFGLLMIATGIVLIARSMVIYSRRVKKVGQMAHRFGTRIMDSTRGFCYMEKEVENTFRHQQAA